MRIYCDSSVTVEAGIQIPQAWKILADKPVSSIHKMLNKADTHTHISSCSCLDFGFPFSSHSPPQKKIPVSLQWLTEKYLTLFTSTVLRGK